MDLVQKQRSSDICQQQRDLAENFMREFHQLCQKYNTWFTPEEHYIEFYKVDPSKPGVEIYGLETDLIRINFEDMYELIEDIDGIDFGHDAELDLL